MEPNEIGSVVYWAVFIVLVAAFFGFAFWSNWKLRKNEDELYELRKSYILMAIRKLEKSPGETCRNLHTLRDPQRFRCSECGCDEKFGGWFRYCPECGRKVVSDGWKADDERVA